MWKRIDYTGSVTRSAKDMLRRKRRGVDQHHELLVDDEDEETSIGDQSSLLPDQRSDAPQRRLSDACDLDSSIELDGDGDEGNATEPSSSTTYLMPIHEQVELDLKDLDFDNLEDTYLVSVMKDTGGSTGDDCGASFYSKGTLSTSMSSSSTSIMSTMSTRSRHKGAYHGRMSNLTTPKVLGGWMESIQLQAEIQNTPYLPKSGFFRATFDTEESATTVESFPEWGAAS